MTTFCGKKYGEDGAEFMEHYNAEIQSWDDKLAAGYWLSFRDNLTNLRHELTMMGIRDQELVKALEIADYSRSVSN